MQLSFKKGRPRNGRKTPPEKLSELQEGEQAILDRIDLPEAISQRLMELGFLPGNSITAAQSAPVATPVFSGGRYGNCASSGNCVASDS